jgi:hypothetical protein
MDSSNSQLTNEALLYYWNIGDPQAFSLAMSSSITNGLREIYVTDSQTLSVFQWNNDQEVQNRVPMAATYTVTDIATDLLSKTGELVVTVSILDLIQH